MEIFLLTFVIVSLAVLGMAVGALAGRQPLKGGCGAPNCAGGGDLECGGCGGGGRDGGFAGLS